MLAVSILSFTAIAARADLFGDLLKVAKKAASVVLDSAQASVEPAATPDSDDPKPVQSSNEAKPSGVEQSPEEAAADAKAQHEFLKAQADLVDAIVAGKPLDAVNAIIAGTGAQLSRALRPGLAATLRPILPLNVSPRDRDASMQAPKVTVVNPGNFQGDLVYFVNGVDVTRESALAEAETLAARIQRPVGLIYNVTNGIAVDFTEATYDRTWPFVVPVVGHVVQANSTTRQVAHLIYHADKRISIVSHSQGCIIVRNALLMANTYTGGKAKDRITWVATALPLRDEEICPKPARFRGLVNPDDTICQFVGLRLKPEKLDGDASAAHDFVTAYVDEIRPEDVR
jgi:hypothetical protein